MSAKELIVNIRSGNGADGRVTALQNVSELLLGHMSAEQFDEINSFIEVAQKDETIPAKRRLFNEEYLKTVNALQKLNFVNIEA